MTLEGHGYAGKCKFSFKWNSTNCKDSKVITRKMTQEEMIKYGVKLEENKSEMDNLNENK